MNFKKSIKKILLIFGTRPEVIKIAPVFLALKKRSDEFDVRILVTAQHRDMLDQTLDIFKIKPDYDLDIMAKDQDLFDVTLAALSGIKPILDALSPDYVLVQGDTTSTFIGALAAFYRRIPVGHVESGLRTYNKYSPFPEEINRKVTGCIADLHFAPTKQSRSNLEQEHVPSEDIFVCGNTSIDALQWVLQNGTPHFEDCLSPEVLEALKGRFILATSHRRESFGAPMINSFTAMLEIVNKFKDISIIFSVHPNPSVRKQVKNILEGHDRIHLINPLDYVNFCHLMNLSEIILTDSGGIQEEGPSLKKPILVLRETTERPEGIEVGTAKLVGTNREKIVKEVSLLLSDKKSYKQMTARQNPYGDGKAAERIVDALLKRLSSLKKRS